MFALLKHYDTLCLESLVALSPLSKLIVLVLRDVPGDLHSGCLKWVVIHLQDVRMSLESLMHCDFSLHSCHLVYIRACLENLQREVSIFHYRWHSLNFILSSCSLILLWRGQQEATSLVYLRLCTITQTPTHLKLWLILPLIFVHEQLRFCS